MTGSLPERRPFLDALVGICGPGFARGARSIDTVAGRRAGFVAVPATPHSIADTIDLARGRGLAVLPRGSGSKIDWGVPPAGVDLLIDTGRLSGMWDHRPEELTVEVATGTPVRALQAALALRGLRLAVDPPSRTATVGGVLAVNESGPLRHRYGPPAEHVDLVRFVDAEGRAGESDGEDGRPGIAEVTGVLTSAVVRLQPLPAARRWVVVAVSTPLQVHNLVEETLAQGLDVGAVEVDLPPAVARTVEQPPGSLAVLVEGGSAAVGSRAERVAGALGPGAVITETAPPWWGRYPFGPEDVALRISVRIADLHAAVYALADAAGGPVPVRGSAGVGAVHAVLPGSLGADRIEAILDSVRAVLMARNGRAVIVTAPPAIGRHVDIAGRRELF